MKKNDAPRIQWSKKAVRDLAGIEALIASVFSPKIAKASIRGIKQRLIEIASHPESCPKDPHFEFDPGKFRYTRFKQSRITFEILNDGIMVHRIYDMRQNPMNWEL